MNITERQKQILERIILDYIVQAKPISSQSLERSYEFGVSPATIRNEMQCLTDEGFLFQPHTSAGRVPTDKGYRFFVNEILERNNALGNDSESEDCFEFSDEMAELRNHIRFITMLTKKLALASCAFAMVYMPHSRVFWKEGWKELFHEPEFDEREMILHFTSFVQDFEENVETFSPTESIEIYIGKENPFSQVQDFTIMATECSLPKEGKGMVAIVGPKRMPYSKNIRLMKTVSGLAM